MEIQKKKKQKKVIVWSGVIYDYENVNSVKNSVRVVS